MQTSVVFRAARRRFLAQGARAGAAFLAGHPASQLLAADEPTAVDPLFREVPTSLLPPDENGLRLPPGFRSRIIARSGQPVVAGSPYTWHDAPDGGACFATADGGWIYVSNSEVKAEAGGGGVGAVRFDAHGQVVAAYPLLRGTDMNCAGGKTPWQTWLSCEEVAAGQVYECDPLGVRPAVVRPALGRFKHEAAAIDTEHGHVYLTEDEPDGCLYRFLPAAPLPFLDSGRLQVAELQPQAEGYALTWHDVPDPQSVANATRHQVARATPFNGGEGIACHEGLVYFTTKGDNRVWRLDTRRQHMTVLYDVATSPTPQLSGVDNVTLTASGDVLVAEDGGDMQIVLLGPAGLVVPILQVTGQDQSEITGPAFDPASQRLYFSSQTGPRNLDGDGITYEISRSRPA